MKNISLPPVLAIGLLFLLTVSSPAAARPKIEKESLVWNLKNARVVEPGQTDTLPPDPATGFPGGTFTSGFTVEARARTANSRFVPNGTFLLTLSAFRPDEDTPTQKGGLWHVTGTWTITDRNADPRALKVRHNPYTIKGRIQTTLPFNPAVLRKKWSAEVMLPMSRAAGRWARSSEGSLTFDSGYDGYLYLTVKLWPEIQDEGIPQ